MATQEQNIFFNKFFTVVAGLLLVWLVGGVITGQVKAKQQMDRIPEDVTILSSLGDMAIVNAGDGYEITAIVPGLAQVDSVRQVVKRIRSKIINVRLNLNRVISWRIGARVEFYIQRAADNKYYVWIQPIVNKKTEEPVSTYFDFGTLNNEDLTNLEMMVLALPWERMK